MKKVLPAEAQINGELRRGLERLRGLAEDGAFGMDAQTTPSFDLGRARERFCYALATGPLLTADVAVVLCGEDAGPRAAVASHFVRTGGTPFVIVSGGKHDPPRWLGATDVARSLYAAGIAPDHILIEDQSQHTREQAVNTLRLIREGIPKHEERPWHRVLLIASAYHLPRAFLTFVRALHESGDDEAVQLIAVPAYAPWGKSPAGMSETRLELFPKELAKCEQYAAHVATCDEGLAYLASWEGR